MSFLFEFIAIFFVLWAFRLLRKPKEEIAGILDFEDNKKFLLQWVLSLFFLGIYLFSSPAYPLVIVFLFFFHLIGGGLLLLNREASITFFYKVPEIAVKLFLLLHIVYFVYNFFRGIFW